MLLTSPIERDGCSNDGDPPQDGDDGQNHGITAQTASSIDVALLQTVSGLNRVKTVKKCLSWDVIKTKTQLPVNNFYIYTFCCF